eukprot:EG_transcript_16440
MTGDRWQLLLPVALAALCALLALRSAASSDRRLWTAEAGLPVGSHQAPLLRPTLKAGSRLPVGPPPARPHHTGVAAMPLGPEAVVLAGPSAASLLAPGHVAAIGAIAAFFATWWYSERNRTSGRPPADTLEQLYASPDEYIVYEKDSSGRIVLSHGGSSNLWMGSWNPDNPLDYGLEYFKTQVAVSLTTGSPRRMLMLGLGIGAIPVTLHTVLAELEVDVVEIDQGVIDGAKQYAHLKEDERFHIYQADAAEFVTRPERHGIYDLVILDCFDPSGVPSVFHAKAFYENALKCLKPDGVFSMNIIWTLPEATAIRAHLRELLVRPLTIYCQASTNCAAFGRISPPGLDPARLLEAAAAVDAGDRL